MKKTRRPGADASRPGAVVLGGVAQRSALRRQTYPTVNSAAKTRGFEKRQKIWNAGFFFQNTFELKNSYFLTLGARVDGNSSLGCGRAGRRVRSMPSGRGRMRRCWDSRPSCREASVTRTSARKSPTSSKQAYDGFWFHYGHGGSEKAPSFTSNHSKVLDMGGVAPFYIGSGGMKGTIGSWIIEGQPIGVWLLLVGTRGALSAMLPLLQALRGDRPAGSPEDLSRVEGRDARSRNITASIPVDFAFPDRIMGAMLTVGIENPWLWRRDLPFGDPEAGGLHPEGDVLMC